MRDLEHGPWPTNDGWGWLYRIVGLLAPAGSARRSFVCRYFRPTALETAGKQQIYRWLGVARFGRYIPTGGVEIRRATHARMKPYTLHRISIHGARDFYYRACVFEALHLPFFLVLLGLAAQRASIGRLDYALQETAMNLAVNLYPMLHHRHTRARILGLLVRAASRADPLSV